MFSRLDIPISAHITQKNKDYMLEDLLGKIVFLAIHPCLKVIGHMAVRCNGKDKLTCICKHNTSFFGTKKTLIASSFKTLAKAVRLPNCATVGRQAHESRFRKIVGVMLYSLCKVLLDWWTTWSQPHNDHKMSLSANGKDISNAR